MEWLRWTLLAMMVLFYAGAGALHLYSPEPFLLITPDWVPFPRQAILATGMCEIAGAIGLLIPRFRTAASVMLAVYAICVFPANVKHALQGIVVPGLAGSWWYHGPRLMFQPVLVWAALFCGGVIDWPWHKVQRD